MKRLNWDTIPSQNVLGKLNVWTSKRTQRDLVLDIRSMEELFSHEDKRASLRNSKVMGASKCEGMDLIPPEVTILDSKRSMNIGIFLRHFKRPVKEIVEDIQQLNWLRFGTGKLTELCKLLPEENEVKKLLSFSGNLSALPEADQFMVQLVKVPAYVERVETMVLREEFFPFMEEVRNSIIILTKAANELMDCDDLHSVIRLVLKAGNYMNAGGYNANVIGFRMTSLLKLADTKANKPGMNLMHYVAKQAEDIDAELLTISNQLDHIGLAARICKEEVTADFEKEIKRVKEVKSYSTTRPDLFQQMEGFLGRAEAKLIEMDSSLQELKVLSDHVAEYFCEDPASFKLEECCSIFHSFCKKFDTAVQENREREALEQRRKRKDGTRQKRRSTLSGPKPEPKADSSSLESALHNFLTTAPEGLNRCRKTVLTPIKGSSSECISQSASEGKPNQGTPVASRESPEKKQSKVLEEDEQRANRELKAETDKMREITRKVLFYQKSKSNFLGDGRSERKHDQPATPNTPRPRTRDYFFNNNGDIGSPWTILSPFVHPRSRDPSNNRHSDQNRLSSASTGDDLDDEVWLTAESSNPSSPFDQNSQSSPSTGSTSLPECLRARALSQAPVLRSLSVDESVRPPSPSFRLGDLFQRSFSQRSFSSGSNPDNLRRGGRTASFTLGRKSKSSEERQGNTSGFISFFKRIGGKRKPGDLEEKNFKGSST